MEARLSRKALASAWFLVAAAILWGSAGAQTGTTSGTATAPAAPSRSSAQVISPDQVRQKLESQGYAQIGQITENGEKYEVTAQKNGHPVHLEVDGKSGNVDEKRF
jgi:hypothetical protein